MPTPPVITWQRQAGGSLQPYSPLFADIYRSSGADGQGGLAQARHAFLMGCGLLAGDIAPAPLWQHHAQWHILETGFGLGLNFLAAWQTWEQNPQRPETLLFSSIEAHPVSAADISLGAVDFPTLAPYADALAAAWQPQAGSNVWTFAPLQGQGQIQLHLYVGDVLDMLPHIAAPADSVFLDGFNPKTNAAMWSAACMQAIAQRSRAGTRLASWTAAASVRDNLSAAGFSVGKRAGLPPKRHSLYAVFPATHF